MCRRPALPVVAVHSMGLPPPHPPWTQVVSDSESSHAPAVADANVVPQQYCSMNCGGAAAGQSESFTQRVPGVVSGEQPASAVASPSEPSARIEASAAASMPLPSPPSPVTGAVPELQPSQSEKASATRTAWRRIGACCWIFTLWSTDPLDCGFPQCGTSSGGASSGGAPGSARPPEGEARRPRVATAARRLAARRQHLRACWS